MQSDYISLGFLEKQNQQSEPILKAGFHGAAWVVL